MTTATPSQHIASLNKWNDKQVFRQDMVKGYGYLIRSTMKKSDALKRVEICSMVLGLNKIV